MKSILLLIEQDLRYVYDISTKEKSNKVYTSIFKRRNKSGYYDEIKNNQFFDNDKFNMLAENGFLAREFILKRGEDGYEYEEAEEIELIDVENEHY
jgi:hypothetical protein